MSDESHVFERAADELEVLSRMSRLEARGTLRLALKDAGLVSKTVNAKAMLVVLDRILPALLTRRGIQGVPEMCRSISQTVRSLTSETTYDGETPEKVFARIGHTSRRSIPETIPPPSSRTPSSTSSSQNFAIPSSTRTPSSSGWSLISKIRNPKTPESDD